MRSSSEFLSRFDPVGRFRDGEGTLNVAFLTNRGGKYLGTLTFRAGLCVAAEMEGSSRWSYPDDSPLTGLRFLLAFEDEEPLNLLVDQGRIRTIDQLVMDAYLEDPGSVDASQLKFTISPRARTTLLSLPEDERYDAIRTVERIAETPSTAWPAERVQRLNAESGAYLARISDELRAFLRVTAAGKLELFDLVSKATLERFLERAKTAGAVG